MLDKYKVNPNKKENDDTPLINATKGGSGEIVKKLIESGADLTIAGKDKLLPGEIALRHKNYGTVVLLKLISDKNNHYELLSTPEFFTCINNQDYKNAQHIYNSIKNNLNEHEIYLCERIMSPDFYLENENKTQASMEINSMLSKTSYNPFLIDDSMQKTVLKKLMKFFAGCK